jgi:hypothetical protein
MGGLGVFRGWFGGFGDGLPQSAASSLGALVPSEFVEMGNDAEENIIDSMSAVALISYPPAFM